VVECLREPGNLRVRPERLGELHLGAGDVEGDAGGLQPPPRRARVVLGERTEPDDQRRPVVARDPGFGGGRVARGRLHTPAERREERVAVGVAPRYASPARSSNRSKPSRSASAAPRIR